MTNGDIVPETGKTYLIGLSEKNDTDAFVNRITPGGWQEAMREADLSGTQDLALHNTTGKWESIDEILKLISEEKERLKENEEAYPFDIAS